MNDHEKKRALIEEAVEIWRLNTYAYNHNKEIYYDLLDKKEAMNLNLRVVKRSVIRGYPKIPFLKIETEKKVRQFLSRQSVSEIRKLISDVKYTLEYHYSYVTIRNWIAGAIYAVGNAGFKKTGHGLNPDAISGKGKTRSRHTSMYDS